VLDLLDKIHWGDAPTWLGVVLAAVGGFVALRLYVREADRDERAAEERRARDLEARRAQAALISAWYDIQEQEYRSNLDGEMRYTYRWGAYLRNASELPVYEVKIDFYAVVEGIERPAGTESRRVVPPGLIFVQTPWDLATFPQESTMDSYVVSITFRDTAGQRWTRDTNGQLLPFDVGPSTDRQPRLRRVGWTAAALVVIGILLLLVV
jgi:arabinogalactan oligomer/maltooligosaccharide transport system substrate-binding protein